MTEVKALTAALRLRSAREKAGFASAAAAARNHNWGEAAYRHHENGTRSFGIDQAIQYASAFKVSASWLLGIVRNTDNVRVPLAKFYVSVYGENLGEGSAMYELIDSMFHDLGLSMFPELTITAKDIEWMVEPNGVPPMHFMKASEIDVDPSVVTDGYIFAFRVPSRYPSSRLEPNNLLLIDSSVDGVGLRPAMYLFRDEAGPFIKSAQSTLAGGALLAADAVGSIAETFESIEPGRLIGKGRLAGSKSITIQYVLTKHRYAAYHIAISRSPPGRRR